MKIIGIERMTENDIRSEVGRGGKFVMYQYCISIVILTFKRPSDIYFIRAGEGSVSRGLPFALISFFLGWWGIPWGPIYTIQSLVTDLGGGKDLTPQVLASLQKPPPVPSLT